MDNIRIDNTLTIIQRKYIFAIYIKIAMQHKNSHATLSGCPQRHYLITD